MLYSVLGLEALFTGSGPALFHLPCHPSSHRVEGFLGLVLTHPVLIALYPGTLFEVFTTEAGLILMQQLRSLPNLLQLIKLKSLSQLHLVPSSS